MILKPKLKMEHCLQNKKPPGFLRAVLNFIRHGGRHAVPYFFFALRFSSIAAWAAARRATGTRYGEQLT